VYLTQVETIIDKYRAEKRYLIAILQEVQEEFHYLPREALSRVKERLKFPLSHILAVATFYNIFSLVPKGKHLISVCTGTACHVKGADKIMQALERELGVKVGSTTPDGKFSLETVRCLGCCSLAPVIRMDNQVFGNLKQDDLKEIVSRYE